MSLRVEFLFGADPELQQIFNRFEDYRDGFGVEFMTVVDAYLTRIGAFPEIAPNLTRDRSPTVNAAVPIRHFLRASVCPKLA